MASAVRALRWADDDETWDDATTGTTDAKENARTRERDGKATATRARRGLGALDVNVVDDRGASPGSVARAVFAGSTPGTMSAKHASRTRAIEVDEDDAEEDAASTMMLETSFDLGLGLDLDDASASPSELDASERAAPTPLNTPADGARFGSFGSPVVAFESPIVGARTKEELRVMLAKIVDEMEIDFDDAFDGDVFEKTRELAVRAKKPSTLTMQIPVITAVFALGIIASVFYASWPARDVAVNIEGSAFSHAWLFGAGANWREFGVIGGESYGRLMRANEMMARRTRRGELIRVVAHVLFRAPKVLAYASAVSATVAAVGKIIDEGARALDRYVASTSACMMAVQDESNTADSDDVVNFVVASRTPTIHPQTRVDSALTRDDVLDDESDALFEGFFAVMHV
ncbi:unnamed product [Ostreococcus tauri]|uniref:Unnamed product n=1 Tax=Ostreococcus tauri TaxID=70448 RepID=A0A096P8N9_OSTTA|nr:unnamed product [Ostreococcus tauri]OUS44282.1 hypothetical protein BE221DRAFT_193732 [Ostreococcus tauri]CEG00350.1 unnamed product [Ostreococcus tauri]|eukprot:XP_022840334.1 unnamed product [Ostreococcus tauri]